MQDAQHSFDKKKYPEITPADMEYRAKLVELIYWPDAEKIKSIYREADASNPDNSHTIAANRIITQMTKKIFKCEDVNDKNAWNDIVDIIKLYAAQLLDESSGILEQHKSLFT